MALPAKPLTVDDWSLLRSRLIWCYEGKTLKEFRSFLAEGGERSVAWFLREGCVTVKHKKKSFTAGKGEWLILAGKGARQQLFSDDSHIVSICFSITWPSGDPLLEESTVIPSGSFPRLLTSAEALVALCRRSFHRVRVDLTQHPADLLLYFDLERHFAEWRWNYLRATLGKGDVVNRLKAVDPRVISALKVLERLPWSEAIVEKNLAGNQGLSVGHLNRLFIRDLGLTPHAHFQKRRLECAMSKLAEGLASIKAIAYELGFVSPAHFSRWFRKMQGIPPREFIRNHTREESVRPHRRLR